MLDVVVECRDGRFPQGQDTALAELAGANREEAATDVDVADVEGQGLTDAQAGGPEQAD